jgi:hypothetical protein
VRRLRDANSLTTRSTSGLQLPVIGTNAREINVKFPRQARGR